MVTPKSIFINRSEVSVKDFGAVGDGITDDTTAIQNTISFIKNISGGVLYFPLSSYLISSTLTIDFDDFILEGNGSTILTNTSVGSAFIPLLIQKPAVNNDVPLTKNIIIKNITINHLQAGPNNSGAIQINNVQTGHIVNVTIKGNGAGMFNCKTDGIAFALGSRDILCENCVVDGLSKGSFYISGAEHITLLGCVAKNGYESLNPFTIGLSIGNARNCSITSCHFYNNRGYGSVIDSGVGQVSATISNLTDQTHFRFTGGISVGSYVASGIAIFDTSIKRWEELKILSATPVGGTTNHQYDIILSVAPIFTLTNGATIALDFYSPRNIIFDSCIMKDNIAGFGGGSVQAVIQSEMIGAPASDILYSNCIVSGGAQGFSADQVQGVRYVNCISYGNTVGLIVQDVGSGGFFPDSSPAENLCNDITILGGSYHDNIDSNIWVQSANDVCIQNARIYHTTRPLTIEVGIKLSEKTVVTTGKVSRNVRIIDNDFGGYPLLNYCIYLNNGQASAPLNGSPGDGYSASYYRVQYPASPITSLFSSPPGSEYTDTSSPTSGKYLKISGTDENNWGRHHSDKDTLSLTQTIRSWSGGLALEGAAGQSVSIGDSSNNYLVCTSTGLLSVVNIFDFFSGTGNISANGNTLITLSQTGPTVTLFGGGSAKLSTDSTGVNLTTSTVQFSNSTSSPTIKQADLVTNSGTGANLTIQAQNETGTTSTGGDLILSPGTGTSINGNINLNNLSTTTTAPSLGAGDALPATPAGYVTIKINGTSRQIAFY